MLGVDIGTTGIKAVLYTLDGHVVAHHTVEVALLQPAPGAAEQDPELIFEAVVACVGCCMRAPAAAGRSPVCVAFSAAMHSLLAVDGAGRPLTRSITWADQRAAAAAAHIRAQGGDAIYRRTGTPIHPMSPLAKLVWWRQTQPVLFAQAARFVGIKEYVFFRLFGGWWVDHSIASATGLFNLQQMDWDAGALELAGLGPERLSTLVPTTHCVQGLPAPWAERPGLAADTPFVIGANDGVLSNLGVNAMQPGDVAVTLGTSGALRAVVGQPRTDPEGRSFCYCLTERHWVVGGPVNNGGLALRWARDALAGAECDAAQRQGVDAFDELARMAGRVAPGAEGLLFHPYLSGERAPLWDADLRGSFFGLGLHHRKPHLVRAVFEGVIFNLHGILPAVEALVGPSQTLRATGGFARSALWRQMLADIFGREVVVPQSFESSCLGAAVLGLYALGRIDSLDAVAPMVGATHRHRPDARAAAVYARLRPIFTAMPARLRDEYRLLAEFQRDGGG